MRLRESWGNLLIALAAHISHRSMMTVLDARLTEFGVSDC